MPDPGSWSYNGDPAASPRDQVRFYCQDTDPAVRLLSDVEVDFVILQWIGTYDADAGTWVGGAYDHPLMAAHGCALRISAKTAGWTTVNADGVDVDLSGLQQRYAALAVALQKEYERISQTGADVDYTNIMVGSALDPRIAPLSFGIGMHDNPGAGQQEFGGATGGVMLTVDESST